TFVVAYFFSIAPANATMAGEGSAPCGGSRATMGGTCTPLTNTTSVDHANTASGFNALFTNTTGVNNTASGAGTLAFNTTGNVNTASGAGALNNNTIPNANTAN